MGQQLPEEVRKFAHYDDCESFARDFIKKHHDANYRRITLRRKTTADNFGIKNVDYLGHSWIEYEGMLLMAYSGLDSTTGSYTVGEHFKINNLTPDQLHDKIIKFKQYCVDVTEKMQRNNSVPTDFIKNVDLYQRYMFHAGLSRSEKEKLKTDFTLADPSTFSFEIEVTDINNKVIIPKDLKVKGATAEKPSPPPSPPQIPRWIADVSLECTESDIKNCHSENWKGTSAKRVKITQVPITQSSYNVSTSENVYDKKKRGGKRRRTTKRRPTKKRRSTKRRRAGKSSRTR